MDRTRLSFRKKAPLVVDVDEMNCLAELTVALKLNQGVRQWLCIVAGVLFFGTFFCLCKRKYRKQLTDTFSLYYKKRKLAFLPRQPFPFYLLNPLIEETLLLWPYQ